MSVIDEIKQKLDIAEVIGQYTTLKKAGRNLTALCPFHSEKHPSFFVYPEQQSWHCFGACNTGGDVFAFLMKKENLDFGEALRQLADRAGVVLPERAGPGLRREEKEEYYQINEAAALYYANLLQNSPAAEKARQYVAKRGFTPETIADFQLGFSLDSWEALKKYLAEKGYKEELMVASGLLYQAEDGQTHDRFRGKLMFPIRDIRGRVTGFGSRVLDDSLPKYVNSPQTPTFDKSGTLYALDRAAPSVRKLETAIVMEGYADVITAHQHGITNAVACMGTAITETQVNIIKKLTRNLVLALDADAAGEEAMLRTVAYENILKAEIRVVVMPEGKDPDDVIKAGSWDEVLGQAVPLLDFLFARTAAPLDLTTARDKSAAADRLLPVLAALADPIRQAHYLQKLAALVKVDMNTIRASLSRLRPAARRTAAPRPAAGALKPLASGAREAYVLALLLHHPELKGQTEGLLPEYFEGSENREILAAWLAADDIDSLRDRLAPALQEHLDAILGKTLPVTGNGAEARYVDSVIELRRRYLRGLAARRAEATGEESDPNQLEEDVAISTQLRELDARRGRQRNGIRR